MKNEALFAMRSTKLTFDTIVINNSDHFLIKMRITCVTHPHLHYNVHNTHLALFALSQKKTSPAVKNKQIYTLLIAETIILVD